jgi:hypothetical protein
MRYFPSLNGLNSVVAMGLSSPSIISENMMKRLKVAVRENIENFGIFPSLGASFLHDVMPLR